jgi:hypothetical protein
MPLMKKILGAVADSILIPFGSTIRLTKTIHTVSGKNVKRNSPERAKITDG